MGCCLSKPTPKKTEEVKRVKVARIVFRWRIVDNRNPGEPFDLFVSENWEDLEMTALANGHDFLQNANLTDEAKTTLEIQIDRKIVDE